MEHLAPNPPPTSGVDHPHPVGGQAELVDQGLLHESAGAGSRPTPATLPSRASGTASNGAGLEGHARVALHGDALRDDHGRVPERGLACRPTSAVKLDREVVGPVIVDAGRVGPDTGLDVDDRRAAAS